MKLKKVLTTALLSLLLLCWAPPSRAALTDSQATQQINGAINTHYASADIDAAEKKLLEVIKACGTSCSPTVMALAWMYVGIVRGSGRDDVNGAQEAFRAAKAADGAVKLDELFATDLVKRLFAQTTTSGAMPMMEDIRDRASQPEVVSGISCTLEATEVETQRPIPISCALGGGAAKASLSYRHESNAAWKDLPLTKTGNRWVGEIPCADTKQLGVLAYRVRALDAQGKEIDTLGTEEEPLELSLVDTTDVPPPALPGQAAPETCRPKKVEEPAGPKLGSYGEACSDTAQCQGGLFCTDGKCTADVSCESDSDCVSGTCIDNTCALPDTDCEGDDCEKLNRVPGNWFGLQGGLDFAMLGGERVCHEDADLAFSCFENGAPYIGVPNDNFAGDIDGGFRTATVRVMLSYERVISSLFSVEGRLGFAFNGGPESPASRGGDDSTFLPFHAEARMKAYFTRVYRDDGSGLKGPSGFVTLGGGLAQVDPHVVVPVGECRAGDVAPTPSTQQRMITTREQACKESTNQVFDVKDVDVYKRLGQAFVTGGIGFRFGFGRRVAAIASVNGQLLLPSVGFTLSPSLGVIAGF
jgi:hypothetical protein